MKYVSLSILLLSSSFVFSQKAVIKTNKESYKYNALIEVNANIDVRCDSFNLPGEFPGFRRVGDITKTSTLSTDDEGNESFTMKHSFLLVAEEKGKLEIQGPVYYIDGREYQAEALKIEVMNEDQIPQH